MGVGVSVAVGVGVLVKVGVTVGVEVFVDVKVIVGVIDGVKDMVGVGVGVVGLLSDDSPVNTIIPASMFKLAMLMGPVIIVPDVDILKELFPTLTDNLSLLIDNTSTNCPALSTLIINSPLVLPTVEFNILDFN